MDSSLVWKMIYAAAIFSLLILAIAYFLISNRELPYSTPGLTEKIAEFKNTRIEGRKEGKKSWEFLVKEGWTSKNQEITHLYNIHSGKIYQNEEIAIMDIFAPYAKAYRSSEIIEVFGQGKNRLRAYLDLGKFSASTNSKNKSEWTKITADFLKYMPRDNKVEITGNVSLVKRDCIIFTDQITVNLESRIADFSGHIQIKRKDGILMCDSLHYLGKEEFAQAYNNVTLNLREGEIITKVKCQRADLYRDIEKDIQLLGSLEVSQGKKLAIAPEGIYSKKQKEILLKGRVKTILEKGEAILKEETVNKLRNPEAKEILKEKTVVIADEIIFSTKNSDAKAMGSVEVTQKGREAKSDYAYYNDTQEILTLTGNVLLKKENEWIKCEKIIVSIPRETFEALGVAEAKFKF